MTDDTESRMGFFEHLEELRKRLIRGVIAIVLTSGVCIAFSEKLFNLLSAPIVALLPPGTPLVFIQLTAPFFVYLKVACITGFFIAFPYILYELWQFIHPGLHPHEKRMAVPFIAIATGLFYAGGAFAYFLVFPAAFKFFLSYVNPELMPMIDIREYVSLVTLLMLAFGAVFETPVVIVFLGLLGLFDSSFLKRGRRYFIVLAFVIAAILTPTPDVINQTLMAVPMLLFYEMGIWVLVFFERKRERELAREASEEAE